MLEKRTVDLKAFYKNFEGKNAEALDPGHRFYVPLREGDPSGDPIRELQTQINFASSESVNLLTGFRGNGKSTELRRLKKLLEEDGCKVFLTDMLRSMSMVKPVELSDFILSLTTALAEAVKTEGLEVIRDKYWKRLWNFLNSEVEVKDLKLSTSAAGLQAELGMKLKTDPNFKQKLQEHLRGHLTQLVEQAREFVVEVVTELRKNDPDLKVVLLVDSLEQIRGVGTDAKKTHDSAVELFSAPAPNMAFPLLHVVYTIPPYLTTLAGNISRAHGGQLIASWPNIHVRTKNDKDDPRGMKFMEDLVAKRFADWNQVFSQKQLHRMARASGGDIRNFFTLLRGSIVKLANSEEFRVDDQMVTFVEQQLRGEITPLVADDARLLARIHATKTAALDTMDDLPRFARLLDGNLIMNYRNGEPWYDVHPLLLEEIQRYAPVGDSPS